MHKGPNGRGRPIEGTRNEQVKARKHRPMRAILKEGLEAALRADPEVLEKCKPKTGAGALVRGLVLEAAKGKMTAFKELMRIVDREPDAEESEDVQGISDEPRWDWGADGVWRTLPEAGAGEAPDSEEDSAAREELHRRLTRLLAGNEADRARAAVIIEAMRTGNLEYPGANGTAAPPA
jgi:hypothetical protein